MANPCARFFRIFFSSRKKSFPENEDYSVDQQPLLKNMVLLLSYHKAHYIFWLKKNISSNQDFPHALKTAVITET